MNAKTSIELLTFNLKLLGRRTHKNILISSGEISDKKALLPAIEHITTLGVDLFATPGTHRFLKEQGLKSTEVNKISTGKKPNILTLLEENRFDLVINILTGDEDYDEASDVKLIRKLAIENGIPLITDVDVAIAILDQAVTDAERGTYRYKLADKSEPWDLRAHFFKRAEELGGLANHHAHIDRAYLISMETLELGKVDMQKKWDLYRFIKENYTHEELVERISRGVESMISQGVTYFRSMVDADQIVKLKPIHAALEVKKKYASQITFEVGIQTLQGVLDPKAREYVEQAFALADYGGGLPSRDRPHPEKHIDIIFSLAKKLGKPIDVHVDQENNPFENETELLVDKTIEYGMQGMVNAVHAISLAAKEEHEQDRIIAKMAEADVGVILCPSAAISMKALPMTAPIHNSIAPFPKLMDAGVRCYLGTDNIEDFFLPVCDGDIWTEARMLMESTRYYDIEKVAEWACRKPVIKKRV